MEAIRQRHQELDRRLADQPFLCDDAFGFADLPTFVFLDAAATLSAPASQSLGSLQGWLGRVDARPAVAKEVDERNRTVGSFGGS